ncbi:MAG: M20 family metallopeptidase [Candidatus Binataceae bacterium]
MKAHEDICRAIDSYREKVVPLSHLIHEHPEPKFEEHFACEQLTGALKGLGLETETGVGGLKTAFRAEFGKSGPTVAILAEYDALPNGHSCGHNLICGSALTAVAGLAAARQSIPGRIVILGTPAEEGGGGKITLMERGAFKGVDAAMMAHPTDSEYSTIPALATQHLRITFHGRAAHAAAAPWDGQSALTAVIQTFQSVDAARLHFRDLSRVHGVITNGGQAVNIIPELTRCEFLARATTSAYAREMADRIVRCAEAAALATGVRMEHELIGGYKNMVNNHAMVDRYARHSEALGTPAPAAPPGMPTGSTDMGDVSHAMPAIHPLFRICDPGKGNCHEDAFVKCADSPRGYDAMIRVAKAMALTAYDLLAEPELLAAAQTEFAAHRER